MRVAEAADVERARSVARALAADLGFGPVARESLALATMELASNLVRHAWDGDLRIERTAEGRIGVVLTSVDRGPGITDIDDARRDGFTTHGGPGLGSGLGAVERLMDVCEITSGPSGTTIVARKWADRR